MSGVANGFVLYTRDGVDYRFDPGTLWLELLLAGGPGELARYDSLHEPADVGAWAARSRLRLDASAVLGGAGDLARARELRDALWTLAVDLTREPGGREPRAWPAGVLEIVNRAASAPSPAPVLAADGTLGWSGPVTASAVLSAVARDAIAVLTGPYADRVRECAAGNCRLVFLDTSRPGNRRWCSMERCGNRHKVRAHRRKGQRRTGSDGTDTRDT